MPKGFIPPPASEEAGDSLPGFLSAKDLGKIGPDGKSEEHEVKVLGFQRVDPSEFDPNTERFGVEVLFNGEKRVMPVKIDSPNHRLLGDAMGKKPSAWIGKTFTIFARKGKFPNPFIAVARPE